MSKVTRLQEQLQRGEQVGVGKRFQWSLYDSVKLKTNDTNIQLFSVPFGQVGSGYATAKTMRETNNRAANTIPQGQMFEAHAMIPYFFDGVAVNNAQMLAWLKFQRDAIFHVKFTGGDDLIQEPLDHILGTQYNMLQVPTVAGDQITSLQQLSPSGYLKLNEKLKFGALSQYEITLENIAAIPAALNDKEVKFRFVGFLKRLES
jgi:hypothetical protein